MDLYRIGVWECLHVCTGRIDAQDAMIMLLMIASNDKYTVPNCYFPLRKTPCSFWYLPMLSIHSIVIVEGNITIALHFQGLCNDSTDL